MLAATRRIVVITIRRIIKARVRSIVTICTVTGTILLTLAPMIHLMVMTTTLQVAASMHAEDCMMVNLHALS